MVYETVEELTSAFAWQTAEGSLTASRSSNMCARIYRVEWARRRNDTISRDEYVQCSLGEHRVLLNRASGKQKGGGRTMNGSRRKRVRVASRHDISHIPTSNGVLAWSL